jgi:hypothetical protein
VLTYTISAGAGQDMILGLTSINSDVTLGVIQPDGYVLANTSNKWTHWQWPLPETGLYKILVVGGATAENFTLTTKIAQRVNFATGTSSIVLNGSTVGGLVFSYSFACQANQTMTVSLNVPNTSAYLDIFGVATGTLLGASSMATSWTVTLPQTQDYIIEVVPNGNQVVNYALTVSVSPVSAAGATNIVFAPGTTAGVVQGTVQPGQVLAYTLSAQASQDMILVLESLNHDVTLGVFEPNGNVLASPANKWSHWQWSLPNTEVYTIQVIGGATTEAFTLTAKVAQRVNFAYGTSSIVLYGTTVNGYVFTYALHCNAGQTMTVSLDVPNTKAYLDVFGLATGSLLAPASKASSWSGTLPLYEDYMVEVIPRNGQLTSYALTINVH